MEIRSYLNRRAAGIENDRLQVTVTAEGGHIAEILHRDTGVNPLWVPPWASIEPSFYRRERHPDYGRDNEAQLLAGILGHNLCLDTFGPPSPEEAAAGMPVHGEASVSPYELSGDISSIRMETVLPKAQLRFNRNVSLGPTSDVVRISEEVENLSASDRPIAWTQHVTLGPPFLAPGETRFSISGTRSQVIAKFNDGRGQQQPGAEFEWPLCPRKDGGTDDLRVYPANQPSGGFTAHLMDPGRDQSWFMAWSPASNVLFGYVWRRVDFPWLARWEENRLRTDPPWNGNAVTCGMEFGVSPFVESRRDMVNRGTHFGVPAFRWIPAAARLGAEYCAFITTSKSLPESVQWDGEWRVTFK
jgi:hypothetical protein